MAGRRWKRKNRPNVGGGRGKQLTIREGREPPPATSNQTVDKDDQTKTNSEQQEVDSNSKSLSVFELEIVMTLLDLKGERS